MASPPAMKARAPVDIVSLGFSERQCRLRSLDVSHPSATPTPVATTTSAGGPGPRDGTDQSDGRDQLSNDTHVTDPVASYSLVGDSPLDRIS